MDDIETQCAQSAADAAYADARDANSARVNAELAEDISGQSFERCMMNGADAFAVAANCVSVYYRPTAANCAVFTPQTVSWTIALLNQRRNYSYLVTYNVKERKVWLTFIPG